LVLVRGLVACATVEENGESAATGAEGATSREGLTTLPPVTPGVTLVEGELLGRPTDDAVTIKAIVDQSVQAYVEYGPTSGTYPTQTTTTTFADGMIELGVTGLAADTGYFYRLRYRATGATTPFTAGTEHRFRTQRSRASTFRFDVQSDSHQGFAAFYSSALYGVTLQNIANDAPDFLFDLGDAVSTDDATETQATVRQKYADQRGFFDIVAHSSPVYLVLGNHENEEGWNLDDMGANVAASLPVLGANARKRYFANPVPDDFYTGNADTLSAIDGDHLRGDYYAFEWGSALFVALDPFWYTTRKPYPGAVGGEQDDEVVGDRWDWTLGKAQYDWLAKTLAESTAPFKFVFAHHPTGGTSDYVRGGALGAKYCEWGGYDIDGTTWGFDTRRPGWAKPVHQLLSENGVTAFFHGHDHVFAMEELDGVVYQECPHAANTDYGSGFESNATDYAGAASVNNSGHLRVTVSPTLVSVDYVRAYLPGDGDNASVAYSYTISPCKSANSDGKACDDGSACTTNDKCASGVCAGTALACSALDECHVAGECQPATGVCSNPTEPDGTACSTGVCAAGACTTVGSGGGAGTGGDGAGASGAGAGGIGGSATGGVTATGGSATGGSATGGSATGGSATGGSGGNGGEAGEAGGPGTGEGGVPAHEGAAGRLGAGGAHPGSGGASHADPGSPGEADAGEATAHGGAPSGGPHDGVHGGGSANHGGTTSNTAGTPSEARGGLGGNPGRAVAGTNAAGTLGARKPWPKTPGCACTLPRGRDDSGHAPAIAALLGAALAVRRRRLLLQP
jgi:hypothetical protein